MKRSTFKILFYLKKSNLKKNGKAAIMGRITIDGEQTQFSTKLEVLPTPVSYTHLDVYKRQIQCLHLNS